MINFRRLLSFFLLGISIALSGCISSLTYYRGLSPTVESTPKNAWVSKGDQFESNVLGKAVNQIAIQYKKGPKIKFSIENGKTSTVSFGPGFLIPLPLIPWPPGIWQSFKHSSPDEYIEDSADLTISVSILYWEHTSVDPSKIDISSDPPGVQIAKRPTGIINTSDVLHFRLEKISSVKKISVKINDFIHYGEKIEIPTVTFTRGKGIRLYWVPSFNG
jgi:hypothetical protein